MKRYLLTVAVIIFSLFLISLAYSAELSERFIDEEHGYSIRYPSSWKARIYRSGIVLANINSDDNKSGLQIRLVRQKNRTNSFVDNYIEDFKKQMNASLIYEGSATIGYIRGYIAKFKSKRGNQNYFLKSYILPIDNTNKIYIFQAGTPYEMRNQTEHILDSIANSFRLK
jgi:hypothetical protein